MRLLIVLFLGITTATTAPATDTNAKKVDQLFAAFEKPGSPGCSVGIIRNSSFVYKKSFGYASLEFGVPLTPESVFYVASVSKQFTAASVVLAAEQGYLSLDDDVHKYLPELPDYGHSVTLRQMLHQTSGFRDFFDLIALAGGKPGDIGSAVDILKLVVRQKRLNNVPGAEWNYSNSNYLLLAEVVQRASRKSLAQFAAENIFQPLGMKHTLFFDDNTLVVPNRAAAYDPGKNGKFLVDWSTSYDLVGGGGLMSTVDDLLLWDRNFSANKLGKGTLVQQLESRGVLNDGNQINYAMGLILGEYRGTKSPTGNSKPTSSAAPRANGVPAFTFLVRANLSGTTAICGYNQRPESLTIRIRYQSGRASAGINGRLSPVLAQNPESLTVREEKQVVVEAYRHRCHTGKTLDDMGMFRMTDV